MSKPTCCHCGKFKANRPRGLCWRCYYSPGVRDLYEPVGHYGRQGALGHIAAKHGGSRLPESPTNAEPGSEAKIVELEKRAARREALFHPGDTTLH